MPLYRFAPSLYRYVLSTVYIRNAYSFEILKEFKGMIGIAHLLVLIQDDLSFTGKENP